MEDIKLLLVPKFFYLINNEKPFIHNPNIDFSYPYEESEEEVYLETFDDRLKNDLYEKEYYFFDMDEDGAPELCISVNNIYIYLRI